jgi:hypothetical protein
LLDRLSPVLGIPSFCNYRYRALQESLFLLNNNRENDDFEVDENLELAIKLSQEEERIRQQNLQKEQELLEQVLRLSLEEK